MDIKILRRMVLKVTKSNTVIILALHPDFPERIDSKAFESLDRPVDPLGLHQWP
jgi:hypothetical protein